MEPLDDVRAASGAPRMSAPRPLADAVDAIERSDRLDPLGSAVGAATDVVARGRRGEALRGEWLGHALHPLMTDVPLGCWLSAGLLDLVGGRRARPAARRLVGLGVLAAVPTAASGLAEYDTITEARPTRVAALHAAGNAAVMVCYLASWRARRRGHHVRGVALGMTGGVLAIGTGYLGGHLSFARRVGTGERGLDGGGNEALPPPETSPPLVADVAMPAG